MYLTVDTVSARVGDTVTVNVKANADEVAAFKFILSYDAAALECVSAEAAGFAAGMDEVAAVVKADAGEIWLTAMALNPVTNSDEVVLTVTFHVLDAAADVNALEVSFAQAIYADYQDQLLDITDGAVNVIRRGNGDVNNDGVVDMEDSFMVYRHASGAGDLTGAAFTRGDVVEEFGIIDMVDAFRVYQVASGALDWDQI